MTNQTTSAALLEVGNGTWLLHVRQDERFLISSIEGFEREYGPDSVAPISGMSVAAVKEALGEGAIRLVHSNPLVSSTAWWGVGEPKGAGDHEIELTIA